MITPKYKIPEYDIPYYEDNTRISNSAIGWFLNKGPAYFVICWMVKRKA